MLVTSSVAYSNVSYRVSYRGPRIESDVYRIVEECIVAVLTHSVQKWLLLIFVAQKNIIL